MAKRFRYKLEAVLKMRKLAEDQVKTQIGRLNVKLNELEDLIDQQDKSISEAYRAQESELSQGLNGQEIQFHPYFVSGKRAHIDAIQSEVNMIKGDLEKLYRKLNIKRGEVKVIEKLKEKEFQSFKKHRDKKQNEQLEEDVHMWNFRKTAE